MDSHENLYIQFTEKSMSQTNFGHPEFDFFTIPLSTLKMQINFKLFWLQNFFGFDILGVSLAKKIGVSMS